jgi:hypothetical protein
MPIQHLFIFGLTVAVVIMLIAVFMPKKSSGSVNQRLKQTQDEEIETANGLVAGVKTWNVNKTADHTDALTRKKTSTFNLDAANGRLERGEQQEVSAHQNFQTVAQKATNNKRSISTQEVLDLEEGTAKIEALKDKALKENEWELKKREHLLAIEGAEILANRDEHSWYGSLKLFEGLVRTRYEIEIGSGAPEVKQRLLAEYDEALDSESKVIRGKSRLLQKVDGEES